MSLNPPTQYADDANLRARQRLWDLQQPPFDLPRWVVGLAGVARGQRVLDVGCGNGAYLAALRSAGASAVGVDLSLGMLRTTAHPLRVNTDVSALGVRDASFDVVVAPHMLYHVPDRPAAVRELRRVLVDGGVCVAVTNGAAHMSALRELVEQAVRVVTPGWVMRNPSLHAFSLENGEAQLREAFADVTLIRPDGVAPVRVIDPAVVADYVASTADHYQEETERPWSEVVADVAAAVRSRIEADGAFVVSGDVGAFVCR